MHNPNFPGPEVSTEKRERDASSSRFASLSVRTSGGGGAGEKEGREGERKEEWVELDETKAGEYCWSEAILIK